VKEIPQQDCIITGKIWTTVWRSQPLLCIVCGSVVIASCC
jgi:hypothetical protein